MATAEVRTVELPSGAAIPVIGQGTWRMGEDPDRREDELAALQRGLELGLSLIDTAEMYGDGAAEELVGEAIEGRRDEVFLVTKLLPSNANRKQGFTACEHSLRRLGTDRVDLYLLHWRGATELAETLEVLTELVEMGKIVSWGVSNLDHREMEEVARLAGRDACQADQVLYNLARRGIEFDLLPWCRARKIPIMAYSPVEQGRLLRQPAIRAVAARHRATPAQVALAWAIRHDLVNAVVKAGSVEHVEENRAALDLRLTGEDLAELDRAFPPPARPGPLEML